MMYKLCCVFIVLIAAGLPCSTTAWTVADETTLRGALTQGYESSVRPEEHTNVFMTFYITSIDEVDLKGEGMSVSGWWAMEWEDSRLTWTPATYSNIAVLIYYQDDLWTPAVLVSNSNQDLAAIDEDTIPIRVNSLGSVYWRPPGVLSLGCDMDTTYFPFDKQVCSIEVLTTGYTADEVILNTTNGMLFDFYSANGEWVIEGDYTELSTISDQGKDYAQVTWYLKLTRRSESYWMSIMFPVLVSSYLICLVFLLPYASGEKTGYALTNLLAFVVILTLVTDEMSTSSKTTSLLEVYVVMILFLCAFSVMFTCLGLHWWELPDEEEVSQVLTTLVKLANTIMCRSHGDKVGPGHKVPANRTASQNSHVDGYRGNFQVPIPGSPAPDYAGHGSPDIRTTEDDPEPLTYKDVANTMDSFLLRMYLFITSVLTFAFLIALTTGATHE